MKTGKGGNKQLSDKSLKVSQAVNDKDTLLEHRKTNGFPRSTPNSRSENNYAEGTDNTNQFLGCSKGAVILYQKPKH